MANNETQSISSSSQYSQFQQFNVARLSLERVENIIFTCMFAMKKKHRFDNYEIFNIISQLIVIAQWIGGMVRVFNFPLFSNYGQIVIDFFAYIDFSISWRNSTFLIIMMVICAVLVVGASGGTFLIGYLSLKGEELPEILIEAVFMLRQNISTLFFIPMINVYFGPSTCLFGNELIQCGTFGNGLLITIGLVLLLILIITTAIFSLFMHSFDVRSAGIFSCQSGYFFLANQISTFIQIALLCLFHDSQPNSIISYALLTPRLISQLKIVIVVVGEIIIVYQLIYIIWSQPFYYWQGNAVYASIQGAKCFLFLEAAVLEFIHFSKISTTETFQTENGLQFFLVWSILLVGVISAGIVSFLLVRFRAYYKWAIKRGQTKLPLLPGKEKKINKLAAIEQKFKLIEQQSHRKSNRTKSSQSNRTSITNQLQQQQQSQQGQYYDTINLNRDNSNPVFSPIESTMHKSDSLLTSATLKQKITSPIFINYVDVTSQQGDKVIKPETLNDNKSKRKLKKFITENEILMSLRYLTDKYIFEGKLPPNLIKKYEKIKKKEKQKMGSFYTTSPGIININIAPMTPQLSRANTQTTQETNESNTSLHYTSPPQPIDT
ncbi:MAG: hypothetical protein EZS28_008442, partial [Streblomastix strix]